MMMMMHWKGDRQIFNKYKNNKKKRQTTLNLNIIYAVNCIDLYVCEMESPHSSRSVQ